MLKGIPYWGETTFEDMRELHRLPVENYTATDWYSLFSMLIAEEYCLIVETEGTVFLTWCSDVVFDYRDKAIFAPYYRYDKQSVVTRMEHKHLDKDKEQTWVHYNFQLCLKPLLIYSCRYICPFIKVYNPREKRVLCISLTSMPYIPPDFVLSGRELYTRYVAASYYDENWAEIEFKNRYHYISAMHGINKEAELRKKHKLQTYRLGRNRLCTYDVMHLLRCKDIRQYDLHVLQTVFNYNGMDKKYPVRWFEYSAYLLLCMLSGQRWIEKDFDAGIRKLHSGAEVFSYGRKELPMYIKHYYLLTDNRTPKTYERYNPYLTLADFDKGL